MAYVVWPAEPEGFASLCDPAMAGQLEAVLAETSNSNASPQQGSWGLGGAVGVWVQLPVA